MRSLPRVLPPFPHAPSRTWTTCSGPSTSPSRARSPRRAACRTAPAFPAEGASQHGGRRRRWRAAYADFWTTPTYLSPHSSVVPVLRSLWVLEPSIELGIKLWQLMLLGAPKFDKGLPVLGPNGKQAREVSSGGTAWGGGGGLGGQNDTGGTRCSSSHTTPFPGRSRVPLALVPAVLALGRHAHR